MTVFQQPVKCYQGEPFAVTTGGLTDAELRAANLNVTSFAGNPVSYDTSGMARSSARTTLFDGKIMNAEDAYKWDTKGTGTATYANYAVNLAVTAGQYVIRQSRFWNPYFSGKPQLIEITHSNFKNEAGVVKRFGYFSSNAVAPYDTSKDGWWIEADGTTYRLITSNNGTETHNIPWTEWDGYAEISNYDFSKFTVFMVDFLWLGGAGLRLFMVVDGAFVLLHTIDDHAGYETNLIMLSPNQPLRYEIRSTSGAGSFNTICSQVATEGTGLGEQGEGVSAYSGIIAANTVGTIYPLIGARKQAAYRNHYCPLSEFGAAILTADAGVMMLLINPTFSAPMTWANNSRIQIGTPAAGSTVTNVGRILKSVPIVSSGNNVQAPQALLRNLACGIDSTMSELVVAYAPQTTNQNVVGSLQVMEY